VTELTTETTTTPSRARRLPMWVIVIAFALLVVFLGLIAWGLNRSMEGRVANGAPAPQFAATTFDGKPFDTKQYAGKVIFVNFWASWCQPCAQEAVELEEAYQHYKPDGQVAFIGLAYVDTAPESLAYLQRYGITYPNGPDLATKISQTYGVRGVPETFIIDRQGKLAYFRAGPFTSTDEVISIVDSILNAK
jgi:cytochrome c biogenesis protein CcmG, thiol:disulfide interchange protein DsbE